MVIHFVCFPAFLISSFFGGDREEVLIFFSISGPYCFIYCVCPKGTFKEV